jgi:hypothetical protein
LRVYTLSHEFSKKASRVYTLGFGERDRQGGRMLGHRANIVSVGRSGLAQRLQNTGGSHRQHVPQTRVNIALVHTSQLLRAQPELYTNVYYQRTRS